MEVVSHKISQAPKLLDQVREAIRVRHYSIRTEKAYVDWIRQYVNFHDNRHPIFGSCLSSLCPII